MQLSRRCSMLRSNRRYQLHKVDQPELPVQPRLGQHFPTHVAPALESMRPDSPHDPSVEPVEDPSDVGALVVVPPAPQDGIESCNQFARTKRDAPLRKTTHLIHEPLNRFLPRIRIKST